LKEAVQLVIKETEPCVRELAATVSAAAVDAEVTDQLRAAAKFARLPGFRPGKAPVSMVRNFFGKNAMGEAVRRFHGAALLKAMEDEKLDVLTYPRPPEENIDLPAGQDYSFTMTVNVAPEFDLPAYRGLVFDAAAKEIGEDAVDAGVARYREMYAEFGSTTAPAAPGDMLKISYTSDLALPEDAAEHLLRYVAAKDSWAWLSDPEILPGMTAGLTGVNLAETRPLTVDFPADFREKELAGKTVRYQVEVLEIQRRQPVSDDAELCRRLNVPDLGQLRTNLREMLERESRQQNRNELRRQAVEQVCGPLREIPLPPMLLAQASEKEFRALANRAVRSEADADAFVKEQEKHLAEARRIAADRLRQFMIFRRIAKAEDIQVAESDLNRQIQSISQAYNITEKDLRHRMAENGGIEDLHVDLLMSKVADFLVENAQGAEKAAKADGSPA
jgi:trigger factor